MAKLGKTPFTDKREKPITVKGTKDKSKDISFQPIGDSFFKKGGFISKGQGKVIKHKITKQY